ncbi:UNVERIFIED_CONTAM: hypothetical protein H355_016720 [Colinus virginianus]|nr:hypothetical protein H355_016720 [Colinus virginianus]
MTTAIGAVRRSSSRAAGTRSVRKGNLISPRGQDEDMMSPPHVTDFPHLWSRCLVPVPRPSVSLHPSHGVAVGDNVTVQCHVPRVAAWVWLYQDGGRTHNKYKEEERDAAEFSFVRTSRELRGIYRCQFHVSEPLGTSELSDPVELVLTDRRYPPPGISVSPEERVRMGTNVTVRCWNRDGGVTVLLHKDGLPVRHQDGGSANFTLSRVIPTDAGTYRCSYRPKDDPFVSSPLGDSVTLEVTPAPSGARGGSRVGLLMAAAGGCATAFGLILIISFLLATRRRRIQTPGEPRKISKVRVRFCAR